MVSGPKVFSLPAGGIAVRRNLLLCRRFCPLVPGAVSPRLRRMERLLPHAALRRVSPAEGSLDFWRSLSAAPLREQNAIQSTQAKDGSATVYGETLVQSHFSPGSKKTSGKSVSMAAKPDSLWAANLKHAIHVPSSN
ncbi:hypothetical protein PCANC_12143 [Puccinia coronata f. sp. avenae]|nr:hypothetical protein PCANC_12143 [Puccinia coronata f. sp. avenae]